MRQAFLLLGIGIMILSVGAFIVFSKKVEAPTDVIQNNTEAIKPMSLALTSPVFEEGKEIPTKYTCDAENISPELYIGNIPEGTISLVLVVDDPDIPDSVKQKMGVEKD